MPHCHSSMAMSNTMELCMLVSLAFSMPFEDEVSHGIDLYLVITILE